MLKQGVSLSLKGCVSKFFPGDTAPRPPFFYLNGCMIKNQTKYSLHQHFDGLSFSSWCYMMLYKFACIRETVYVLSVDGQQPFGTSLNLTSVLKFYVHYFRL